MSYIHRQITPYLEALLSAMPAVTLLGARQVGKSTLVGDIAKRLNAEYISLDSITELAAARADPQAYINNLPKPIVIDEIQRAPELFLPIKYDIDQHRSPGRYLFTGSANVLSLPKIADSLAGRMGLLQLYPLSQTEILGTSYNAVDALFAKDILSSGRDIQATTKQDIVQRIVAGGYPDLLGKQGFVRQNWLESYITSVTQRDIRELADIEGLLEIPKLLWILAARSATMHNVSAIAREAQMPYNTLKRYLSLLQATFMLYTLPAWTQNLSKKATKSPKVMLSDTSLICGLLRMDVELLEENGSVLGRLLETFVTLELQKQASWSKELPKLHHYRSNDQKEVDVVLEGRQGRLLGVEVKLARSLSEKDFRGLRDLEAHSGGNFFRGIVFAMLDRVTAFSDSLFAVPIQYLWQAPTS